MRLCCSLTRVSSAVIMLSPKYKELTWETAAEMGIVFDVVHSGTAIQTR